MDYFIQHKRWHKNNGDPFLFSGGCLIGQKSKKVLDFEVKQRACYKCKVVGENVAHDCSCNFKGPPSQMESVSLQDMAERSVQTKGVVYKTIITDGSSLPVNNLIATRVYEAQNVTIKKVDCTQHKVRNIVGHLASIVETTNFVGSGVNTAKGRLVKTIRRSLGNELKRTIRDAVVAGHNAAELHAELLSVLHHFFNRCNCGQACPNTANRNVPDYCFEKLKDKFLDLFLSAIESLILNKSTNLVESFNNIVCMMIGGKRVNYSMAKSYRLRYAAAVVQWNEEDVILSYLLRFMNLQNPEQYRKFVNKRTTQVVQNRNYHRQPRRTPDADDSQAGAYNGRQRPDLPHLTFDVKKQLHLTALDAISSTPSLLIYHPLDLSTHLRARAYLVMASEFSIICTHLGQVDARHLSLTDKLAKLCTKMISPQTFQNTHKSITKAKLEFIRRNPDATISQPQVMIHLDPFQYLGAVIHGIINHNGQRMLLYCKQFKHDRLNSVRQLRNRNLTDQNALRQYFRSSAVEYCELQGSMAISNIHSSVVVLLAGNDYASFTVDFDVAYWNLRLPVLDEYFWYQIFEKIDSRRLRGMPLYTYAELRNRVEDPNFRQFP